MERKTKKIVLTSIIMYGTTLDNDGYSEQTQYEVETTIFVEPFTNHIEPDDTGFMMSAAGW